MFVARHALQLQSTHSLLPILSLHVTKIYLPTLNLNPCSAEFADLLLSQSVFFFIQVHSYFQLLWLVFPIERFSFKCRMVISFSLVLHCFAMLGYWPAKFTPLSQPMRSNTKTNRDLHACIFPRFTPVTWNCFEFWLAHCGCLRLLWLAGVIALVLILRRSIEKRSLFSDCDENKQFHLVIKFFTKVILYSNGPHFLFVCWLCWGNKPTWDASKFLGFCSWFTSFFRVLLVVSVLVLLLKMG